MIMCIIVVVFSHSAYQLKTACDLKEVYLRSTGHNMVTSRYGIHTAGVHVRSQANQG